MDLPTYTNIWRIEKRLYKLYDLRLPMPLPIVWIGVFVGVFVPWSLLLVLVGVPVQMPWHVLFLVPPGIVTWLSTRPVIEGKRLTELLESQLRYLGQPKAWYRLAPSSEPEVVTFSGRVWRTAPARAKAKAPRKARQPQRKRDSQRLTGPRQVRPAVAAAAAAAAAAQAPVAEPPSRTGWGTRRGTAPALKGRVRQGAPAPSTWLEEGSAGRPVSLLDEAVGTAHGSPGTQYVDADLVERETPDEGAVDTSETAAEDTGAGGAVTEQKPDADPLGAHEELSAETVAAREAGVPIKTAESRKPAAGKPIDTEALRRLRRLAASADAPPETAAEPEVRRRPGRGEDEVARDQHRKGQPPRLPQTGLVLPGASPRVWPPLNPNAKPLPRPATRGAAGDREPTAPAPSHPAPDDVASPGEATISGKATGSGGASGSGEAAHDQPQAAAPEAPAEALTAPEAIDEAQEPEPATEDSSPAPAADGDVAAADDLDATAAGELDATAAGDDVASTTDEPGDEAASGREAAPEVRPAAAEHRLPPAPEAGPSAVVEREAAHEGTRPAEEREAASDRDPSPADRLAAPGDGEVQERREAEGGHEAAPEERPAAAAEHRLPAAPKAGPPAAHKGARPAGERKAAPADRLAAPGDGEAQERRETAGDRSAAPEHRLSAVPEAGPPAGGEDARPAGEREVASAPSAEAPADDVSQERREAASVRDAGRPGARATRAARGPVTERAGAVPMRAGAEPGPSDAEPGPTDVASEPTGVAPGWAEAVPGPSGVAAERADAPPERADVAHEATSVAHEVTGAGRGGQAGDVVAPVPGPRPGEGKVRRVESVVGRDSGGWRRIAQVVVGAAGCGPTGRRSTRRAPGACSAAAGGSSCWGVRAGPGRRRRR
ncbi:similar to ATPase involved in chromosome partitioning [[Actinomadura] parvosata subsp. kistnae]|uniref:TcpE family conjugal transfer membrane protein n=1 Tax=[Actinomadura] parvosata TaxID=1955412 RepID=UPI000D2E3A36|nr:similar to ATPase involved in chromosome partitioning [Actinomadura parvosata subsp. kistnae]